MKINKDKINKFYIYGPNEWVEFSAGDNWLVEISFKDSISIYFLLNNLLTLQQLRDFAVSQDQDQDPAIKKKIIKFLEKVIT